MTNKLKLRLGHQKLGFIVSTELIKYQVLYNQYEGSEALENTKRFHTCVPTVSRTSTHLVT